MLDRVISVSLVSSFQPHFGIAWHESVTMIAVLLSLILALTGESRSVAQGDIPASHPAASIMDLVRFSRRDCLF